jgi:iron complex outermembrane receptor protein
LIAGFETTLSQVSSSIFGNPNANTLGFYAQAERKISKPISITAGLRFDYSKIQNLKSVNSISPKIGFNFKPYESTILRLFSGTGFRAPTLAETFTSTTASGIDIKPNLNLKAENNYSIEAGINQLLFNRVYVDAAIFNSEYFDLIEPSLTGDASGTFIQFRNLTRARIQGLDLSTNFLFPEINASIKIAYSYLWARDIENKTALKYRPRNTVYAEAEYTIGDFNFGIDLRYWTKVEEIDKELIEANFVKNGDKRVEVIVADIRGGFSLFTFGIPANINLNINNLFNYNYIEVIGNISPIRNISLNLELLF